MMRCLFLFLICVALIGCQKAPSEAPPAAPETAQATPPPTPPPTPEPTPTPIDTTAQAIVLCYHRFEEKPKDSLAIKPAEFEAQLKALQDHGIAVISMDDFLAWRRGEKSIPPKSAVISIDDGYVSGYNVAWPILKKFGYPFTMYIYTDYVKGGKKSGGQSITWAQLAEMRDAGVDIGSHTASHSALNARKKKTDEEYAQWLVEELAGSKQLLENQLGIQVKTLAFPYGLHNEAVRKAAMDAGYEAAFTVYGQRLTHGADASMLGRYAIESTKPQVFQQAVGFAGSVAGPATAGEAAAMPASATMVTLPMDGQTINDPLPEIKANLATLGEVDPKSVVMRLSGFGQVPAQYDPETKLLSYKMTQRLRASQISVIVSAMTEGRKVEARWTFHYDPNATPAAEATPLPASSP